MATKEKTVELRTLDIRTTQVLVQGTGPGLLIKRMEEKTAQAISDKNAGKGKQKAAPRTPEEDADAARYKLRFPVDGATDGIKAVAFKAAMVRAGKALGYVMVDLQNAFFIDGDQDGLIPLYSEPPVLDSRPGRNPSNKAGIIIHRPIYRDWKCCIPFRYNAGSISEEELVNLLNCAGFSPGVGENRPGTSGDVFGQFKVISGE